MEVLKRIKANALIALFLSVFLSSSAMAGGTGSGGGNGPPVPTDRVRTIRNMVSTTGYIHFQYVPAGTTVVQEVHVEYRILKDEYKRALEKSDVTQLLEVVVEAKK